MGGKVICQINNMDLSSSKIIHAHKYTFQRILNKSCPRCVYYRRTHMNEFTLQALSSILLLLSIVKYSLDASVNW